ncbi:MAG: HD domain-containing protein [Deltaproteobacteria bacterium]
MKKDIFINNIIRENMEVNDSFMVIKKGIFSSKNNAKYMSVELKDKTGKIEGKIWDNADIFNKLFDKNDIVSIKAKSRFYQGKPQLTINDIRKAEQNLTLDNMRAFFAESTAGIDLLKEEYYKVIDQLKEPHIISLFSILNNRKDTLEKFFLYPASIGVHHVYMGGLLEHSLSLVKMGMHAAKIIGGDTDIIIAGSLLHDIGKVEEIEMRGGFKYSDRGRLLGHITLGVMMLEECIKGVTGFPAHIADVLAHIIISHHGVEEWGSPKKPMSLEALMVHYLDNLDAKVMGVKEHMRDNMEDEKWTEYHKLYESRFYKLPGR